MKHKAFFRICASAVLLAIAMIAVGCSSGREFNHDSQTRSRLVPGVTTMVQAMTLYGVPYQTNNIISGNHHISNATYVFSESGIGGGVFSRSLALSFENDILMSYSYLSTYPHDSTMFDSERIKDIIEHRSTLDDVLAILGKPSGAGINLEDNRHFVLYSFMKTMDGKFCPQFAKFTIDDQGVVVKKEAML